MKLLRKGNIRRILVLWILLLVSYLPVYFELGKEDDIALEEDSREYAYSPGVYSGEGKGFLGDIRVSVKMKEDSQGSAVISDIAVIEINDIKKFYRDAIEHLKKEVMIKQSTDIDAVTGATYSSRGFLEAVDDAKQKALRSD